MRNPSGATLVEQCLADKMVVIEDSSAPALPVPPPSGVDERLGDVAREIATPTRPFVPGVDTLRLFAAAWVVFYHGAAPPLGELVPSAFSGIAERLAQLPFNGNAAVVLFFVISGFCIHLGNVDRPSVAPIRFLAQRFVRIAPALIAITVIANLAGEAYRASLNVVLWSVYCELIYYAVYPFIFPLFARKRILAFLALSAAVSLAMAIWQPGLKFLWQFQHLTALYCWPMWVLGCLVADAYRRGDLRLPTLNVWALRIAAIGFGSLSLILGNLPRFAIGYIWTMPVFAVLCAVWIWNEITSATRGEVVVLFERLGLASYSIYLVHKPAITAVIALDLPWYLAWPGKILAVAVASFAFYALVERPSHKLSRWIGRLLRNRQVSPAPEPA